MPEFISFIVPIKTVSELNQRGHWAVRAKRIKEQRDTVKWIALALGLLNQSQRGWRIAAPLPAAVTLTRIAPRMLDEGDNLNSSMKGVRDEVAAMLGLASDRDPRVSWSYDQHRGKPKQYAVRIMIARAD